MKYEESHIELTFHSLQGLLKVSLNSLEIFLMRTHHTLLSIPILFDLGPQVSHRLVETLALLFLFAHKSLQPSNVLSEGLTH